MHVVIDIAEFNRRIKNSKTFPFENEDVFIVEGEAKTSDNRSEKNYQPLKRYRVKNNTLIMEKDFIKHGKNATKKDYDRVSKLSLDKIIQWSVEYAINRGKDNTTSFADYEAYTNEFRKRFRYFYSVESFCYDKNDNGKMAAVPKILCDQNFPVEDHIKELELLLPYFSYINWSDEINEAIQISIFEENLSYNGIYLAYIKKDGKGILTNTYRSRLKILIEFENYKDLIKYIWTYLPYQRPSSKEKE